MVSDVNLHPYAAGLAGAATMALSCGDGTNKIQIKHTDRVAVFLVPYDVDNFGADPSRIVVRRC